MPSLLITHTVDVYRLTRNGTRDSYGDTPVVTGLDVSISPAGTDIVAVYGSGPNFALFEIYTMEPVDLKNGDKLVTGSEAYVVRGVPQVVENRFASYRKVVGQQVV